MPAVMAVHLTDEELEALEAMAVRQNLGRAEVVRRAVRRLIDDEAAQRRRRLAAMQKRLAPALEAQDALLSRGSFAVARREG